MAEHDELIDAGIRLPIVATIGPAADDILDKINKWRENEENDQIVFHDPPDATDIFVLALSADGDIPSQTIEHVRTINVPIVVAINDVDNVNANIPLVLSRLARIGITPLEWGGDYAIARIFSDGRGIPDLMNTLEHQLLLRGFSA